MDFVADIQDKSKIQKINSIIKELENLLHTLKMNLNTQNQPTVSTNEIINKHPAGNRSIPNNSVKIWMNSLRNYNV